ARAAAGLLAPLLAAVLALAGCDDEDGSPPPARASSPAAGGTLRIAVADEIEALDPLYVRSRAERLASRQVYEPLRTWQTGPFGDGRRRPGGAPPIRPNPAPSVWAVGLR